MQLVISNGDTSLVAVDGLESMLEHGSLAVRLDQVATLLEAIRAAAAALTPSDAAIREADPARAARVAQAILLSASAARALAIAAPPGDANAAIVLGTLAQLQVEPSELNPVRSITVEYATSGHSVQPVIRFPAAARVLGAYLISNATVSGSIFEIAIANADSPGTVITADGSPSDVVAAGSAYPLTVRQGGPEMYEAGELAVVQVDAQLALASFSIQLDYQLRS